MSEYTPEDLERRAAILDAAFIHDAANMLRAGAQAMRDLIEARAERDVAVIAKENAERILQTLNQDDLRHQWIAMKTHREAEAKARLDAEDALAKAEARVKELEDQLRNTSAPTCAYECSACGRQWYDGIQNECAQAGNARSYGKPPPCRAALQVKPKPDAPGIGWKLSDEAKKDIAEIERHAKFYR